jgi:hypothetical protein
MVEPTCFRVDYVFPILIDGRQSSLINAVAVKTYHQFEERHLRELCYKTSMTHPEGSCRFSEYCGQVTYNGIYDIVKKDITEDEFDNFLYSKIDFTKQVEKNTDHYIELDLI